MSQRKPARFQPSTTCPRCTSAVDEDVTLFEVYRMRLAIQDGLDPTQKLRRVRCTKPGCPERIWVRAKHVAQPVKIGAVDAA